MHKLHLCNPMTEDLAHALEQLVERSNHEQNIIDLNEISRARILL
jgi:hypothetical protein